MVTEAHLHGQKEGSLLGGILMVAGSCIGAGMLALPVTTGQGGFLPATVLFVLAWLFMTTTSLLLVEANLTLGHHLSLISLADRTLGHLGKAVTWIFFLFLFYSLGVAYIAASGDLVQLIARDLLGVPLPSWVGGSLFTLLFALVLLRGTRPVDHLNRLLMGGLIIAYAFLIFLGIGYVELPFLKVQNWSAAWGAVPILVISFGFHNMVPTLAHYYQGNGQKLRKALILGGAIALVIYLFWEVVILGIVPMERRELLAQAVNKGQAVTETLEQISGFSSVFILAQFFAFFAITTSFLTQSLSLIDFLADGFKVSKRGLARAGLILLAILPSFLFTFLYPGLFIAALNFAGGVTAVVLFGVLPALMVWKLRFKQQEAMPGLIPSGRPFLLVIIAISIAIFLQEVVSK